MESRGRVMVPVPANADSGNQGPAQTLYPSQFVLYHQATAKTISSLSMVCTSISSSL